MKAPKPIQEEIRNKVAEISRELAILRYERNITTYKSLRDYGIQVNVFKNVMKGKRYTVETLLLLLHELNYTITLTPKTQEK